MRETDKFVFFYGGYLSQWHPCEFFVDGMTFNCAEQYFMHEKAKLFGDGEIARMVMEAEHPKIQKALGKRVTNFNEEKWNTVKQDVALFGNWAKFLYNEELAVQLIGTRNKILVEASPYDKVWGVGLPEDDPAIDNPDNWLGQNLLGIALMRVRSLLNIHSKDSEMIHAYQEYKKLPKAELSGPNRDALMYRNRWCVIVGRSYVHPHPHRHLTLDEFKQKMKTDKLMQAHFNIKI